MTAQPTPGFVLNSTGDIAYQLKTALRALETMKPRTKTDLANVACIRAQLEAAMKLNQGLHEIAAQTINAALEALDRS